MVKAQVTDSFSDVDWTGRLALNFRPADGMLLYATLGRGYKSGGYSGGFLTKPSLLVQAMPETMLAYEVGAKTAFFDQRLIANIAAFYYDYSDLQAFAVPPGEIATTLTNLDGATSKGIEFDLAAQPVTGLNINFGLGLLDAKIKDERPAFKDGTLPNAPKVSMSARIRYEWPLGLDPDGLKMAIMADYFHVSSQYKEVVNLDAFKVKDQGKLGARLALMGTDNVWELAIWGKNLLNKNYVVDTLAVPAVGQGTIVYDLPRTYGLSLEYNF